MTAEISKAATPEEQLAQLHHLIFEMDDALGDARDLVQALVTIFERSSGLTQDGTAGVGRVVGHLETALEEVHELWERAFDLRHGSKPAAEPESQQ